MFRHIAFRPLDTYGALRPAAPTLRRRSPGPGLPALAFRPRPPGPAPSASAYRPSGLPALQSQRTGPPAPPLRPQRTGPPASRPSGCGLPPSDFLANYCLPTRLSGRPLPLRADHFGFGLPAPAFPLRPFGIGLTAADFLASYFHPTRPSRRPLTSGAGPPAPALRFRSTAHPFCGRPPGRQPVDPTDSTVGDPSDSRLRPSGAGPPAPAFRIRATNW